MQRGTGDRVLGRSLGRKFNFSLRSHTSFPGQNLYFVGLRLSIPKGNQITKILHYLFWQSSSSESPSGSQNIPTGRTVIFPPTTLWHSTVSLNSGWWNKIAEEFTRDSSAQQFVGPEPTLGISVQNISHLCLGLQSGSGFPTKSLYVS